MHRTRLSVRQTTRYSWVVVAVVFAGWPLGRATGTVPPVQSGQIVQAELADWLGGVLTGVYVEGSELRLQDGVPAGTYESQPLQTPFAVNAATLQWHAQVEPSQLLALDLRSSVDGQTWTDWLVVRGRPARDGSAVSQVFVLPPGTTWLQYRVRFESANGSPTLADTTVWYLDTSAGGVTAAIDGRVAAVGPPALTPPVPLIAAAESGTQTIQGDIARHTPRRILLASLDTPADDPNSAATIRALQWVGATVDQRTVLPFHFLIDGTGTVFQGPGSATAVLPDIAEGTVGIALLTNAGGNGLNDAVRGSLGRLLGWLLDAYDLDLDAIDVAPDAPSQLREALPELRAIADRSVVRSRIAFAAGNTAFGTERLVLFNPGTVEARASIMVLSPLSPERREVVVLPGERFDLPLNTTFPVNGPLGVEVLADRRIYAERTQSYGRELLGAPAPPPPARTWYFAEASSADGDSTTLDILNPQERDVAATLLLVPDEGAVVERHLTLGARTQQSVFVSDVLPGQRVAVKLVAAEPVVMERTAISANGAAAISPGVVTPMRHWWFAEGSTLAGYRTTLLLFNPWAQEVGVTLRVRSEDGTSLDRQYTLPAQRRRAVLLNEIAPDLPFALDLTAARPVVAERSISFDDGGGFTIGAGATRTATRWSFPEGTTAEPAEEYLLVANPNPQPVGLEVAYLLPNGETERRAYEVGAGARLTISANLDVPGQPTLSAVITAERPVVAERTLYVDSFQGRGGETALGIPAD